MTDGNADNSSQGATGGDSGGTTANANAGASAVVEQRPALASQGEQGKTQEAVTAETPAWKVPDAYKEKPWAAKLKSEDDLYKQLDALDTAVGKKHRTPDFKTATPQELDEYFNTLRPTDKAAYKFGEENTFDPEFTGSVADMLYNAGVSEHQAAKLIPAYQAVERQRLEQATSADGFKSVMAKSFGDKYDGVVAGVVAEHKQHLSVDDQKLLDTIPNEYLGVVYRLTEKMRADKANIVKQYGAHENGDAHAQNNVQVQAVDMDAKRADLRKKISDIGQRNHTAEEKQKLIDELQATYATTTSKGK